MSDSQGLIFLNDTVANTVRCCIQVLQPEDEKNIFGGAMLCSMVGGFCATRVAFSNIEQMEIGLSHPAFQAVEERFYSKEELWVDVIFIAAWAFDHMSIDQISTLVLHEYGHVLHKDYLNATESVSFGQQRISTELKLELRADNYAAFLTSKATVKDALKAVMIARMKAAKSYVAKAFILGAMFFDKNIRARMNALSS